MKINIRELCKKGWQINKILGGGYIWDKGVLIESSIIIVGGIMGYK